MSNDRKHEPRMFSVDIEALLEWAGAPPAWYPPGPVFASAPSRMHVVYFLVRPEAGDPDATQQVIRATLNHRTEVTTHHRWMHELRVWVDVGDGHHWLHSGRDYEECDDPEAGADSGD